MSALLERIGVELPVVQAGMGGGVATHQLAAAVSDAGALGTIGMTGPDQLAQEIAAARSLTGRPIAVNVLLPFARSGHWEAARDADIVTTFWGRPKRRTPGCWIHQCGSEDEALAAHAAGADGVIAQGVEAGGHVRGTLPALELLAGVRRTLPDGYPVLLAGGVAEVGDVETALDAGADAAVLGTRFVMSDESGAHDGYKNVVAGSRETVLTELFGAGWPAAPHRVVPNAATRRWLRRSSRGPAAVRLTNVVLGPLMRRAPFALHARLTAAQRTALPLFSPTPPTQLSPAGLLDTGPLYAGETVARIDDVRPARELVRALVPR